VISNRDSYLFVFGSVTFQREFWNLYGVIMAGASLSIIPLFIAVQPFIIEGVVLTGLKG